MIEWKTEKRLLATLNEHPSNPRDLSKHDLEHLDTSIEKFGIIDKIVINTDGMIIGGHQRKKVLKNRGIKEVECLVPSRTLTKEEVDELNIRLNRNQGEWNWDILANDWNEDDLLNWGFTEEDFGISEKGEDKKRKKPKIIIEFKNEEDLKNSFQGIEDVALSYEGFVKVKI